MSVASTTRRRPGGDGARARSCSSTPSAPARGRTSTEPASTSVSRSRQRMISPTPGRNTSTSPSFSVSASATAADSALEPVAALARRATRMSTGMSPSGDLDRSVRRRPRRRGEQSRESCRVGGCRHREDAQVGSQRRGHVERSARGRGRWEVALVHLVEQHRGDAGQFRVVLQPPGQHALGEHLDSRRRPDVALVAGLVPDEVADRWPARSAIRRAAARVANRRGSSTTILPSPRHAASSRASGMSVVLPAPGGALTTARCVGEGGPDRVDLADREIGAALAEASRSRPPPRLVPCSRPRSCGAPSR